MRVMDGLCGMGRVSMFVSSLELGESEDEEDEDEVEVLSSSLSASSSEDSAFDSEEADSDADDDCDVPPSESNPASNLDELRLEDEEFFFLGDGDIVAVCAIREVSRRAYSIPFSLLVIGGGFEVASLSGKVFLFVAVVVAVAIEAHAP